MDHRPITRKEAEALRHIRNRIVHGEEAPSIREIQEVLGYRSPNAAAYLLQRLIAARYLRRRSDGKLQLLQDAPDDPSHATTIQVPLVGSVPCGAPLLAEENVEALIPVSTRLARPPHRYFLLRAVGNSMDKAGIRDGDLVLVRQQPTAKDGDRVVALIDDEATIKEFHRKENAVVLMPRSSEKHRPIVLTTDFLVQGIVQATIEKWERDH